MWNCGPCLKKFVNDVRRSSSRLHQSFQVLVLTSSCPDYDPQFNFNFGTPNFYFQGGNKFRIPFWNLHINDKKHWIDFRDWIFFFFFGVQLLLLNVVYKYHEVHVLFYFSYLGSEVQIVNIFFLSKRAFHIVCKFHILKKLKLIRNSI